MTTSFTLQRLSFPLVELARECRTPLRRRYGLARRGLDFTPLRAAQRRAFTQPWEALAGLIGAAHPSGPVWAVTVVRNEERRLEGSIRLLLEGGVDVVVVADNLSTDGTRELLKSLECELPIVVLSDSESGHYQGTKISLMARAAARAGASWIVPFDADELWYGIDDTIANRLRALDGDAAIAPMYEFLPAPSQHSIHDPYAEITQREPVSNAHKLAFRAHLLATVASGNHSVSQPVRAVRGVLTIRHYPYLGVDHFIKKNRLGKAAIEATDLPANIGEHWRVRGAADDEELRRLWHQYLAYATVSDPLPSEAFVRSAPSTSPPNDR